MNTKYYVYGWFVLGCSLFLSTGYADQVYLQDGSRYEGTVSNETEAGFDLQTAEGTMIITKKDVLHIERDAEATQVQAKKKRGFFAQVIDMCAELPKNNFFLLRKHIRLFHLKIFAALDRNLIYQYIAYSPQISEFRTSNRIGYILGVYSCLVLLLALLVSIVQSFIVTLLKKFYRGEDRYDRLRRKTSS